MQLGWFDDDVLAIGRAQRSLEAIGLQSLHPNRDTIAVPVHELDPIATQVEEHKNPSVSHVEMKV